MTQCFTIMTKLNILKQTVSKKVMVRLANNGWGEDSYVSHAIFQRKLWRVHLWCHRKDGTIQDGKCFEFGRAFTKQNGPFEKKSRVPLMYLIYLLNIYVKRKWTFFGFTCPLTPIGEHDRISPYNINTMLSRQVMRLKKNISKGIVHWSNTKFSKLRSQDLYGRQ